MKWNQWLSKACPPNVPKSPNWTLLRPTERTFYTPQPAHHTPCLPRPVTLSDSQSSWVRETPGCMHNYERGFLLLPSMVRSHIGSQSTICRLESQKEAGRCRIRRTNHTGPPQSWPGRPPQEKVPLCGQKVQVKRLKILESDVYGQEKQQIHINSNSNSSACAQSPLLLSAQTLKTEQVDRQQSEQVFKPVHRPISLSLGALHRHVLHHFLKVSRSVKWTIKLHHFKQAFANLSPTYISLNHT